MTPVIEPVLSLGPRRRTGPHLPTTRMILIFMSFHHICLRTRLAPLRNPCAETARLSEGEQPTSQAVVEHDRHED